MHFPLLRSGLFLVSLLTALLAVPAFADTASCKSSDLKFGWPMAGAYGVDWVINNYIDLDPGTGALKDWMGNTGAQAKTYDGHQGTDIDLSDFRKMDPGFAVRASAPGVVTEAQDDLFDRNMEAPPGCGPWNHVYIKHANGYVSWYGHLKFGSLTVKVGQTVKEGDTLGAVGSAGCSSTAHVHFEVHDCDDKVVDPWLQGMFKAPPPYSPPLKLMDLIVRKGAFPDEHPTDALIKDPQPNATLIPAGGTVGIAVSAAGGGKGDRIDVVLSRENGVVYHAFPTLTFDSDQRHSWPRWWVALPHDALPGSTWVIHVSANGQLIFAYTFTVASTKDEVFFGEHDAGYQQNYDSLTKDGYEPVAVDGDTTPEGGARMTGIFRLHEAGYNSAKTGQTAAQWQTFFTQQTALHKQLMHIDSYMENGVPVVAGIFRDQLDSNWMAYHLVTQADHQARFTAAVAQGFVPYAISPTWTGTQVLVSAVYKKAASKGFVAKFGMNSAAYQAEMNAESAKGLAPVYVKGYTVNGVGMFSAIWSVEGNSIKWVAKHDLSQQAMFDFATQQSRAGLFTRAVTSYMSGNLRLYAGVWSQSNSEN